MKEVKQKLEKKWSDIRDASTGSQRLRFLEYCQICLEGKQCGDLSPEDAAYQITGIGGQVFEHLGDSEQRIVEIAGELELPEAHRGIEMTSGWQEVTRLVQEGIEKAQQT